MKCSKAAIQATLVGECNKKPQAFVVSRKGSVASFLPLQMSKLSFQNHPVYHYDLCFKDVLGYSA